MDRTTLRKTAFAMPPTSPAFPPGPYRFVDREYFIIRYRTDPRALRRVVPEPLEIIEPVVNYEFIRMPDSTGFGDYTETGWVRTPLVEKQIADIAARKKISHQDAAMELLGEKQPSRAFVTPEQLGGTVAFLCSPAADQITGTAIAVDGAWTAQ